MQCQVEHRTERREGLSHIVSHCIVHNMPVAPGNDKCAIGKIEEAQEAAIKGMWEAADAIRRTITGA